MTSRTKSNIALSPTIPYFAITANLVALFAHGPLTMHPDTNASTSSGLTVREAVYDLMRRFGLTTVFANPGSTELPMFRDFPADFRYVLGLHEGVVVGMADGFAQATRNAAFVNLHSAAGVGNAMGLIFTAHKNKTPLVITAGQQARSILPYDPFLASTQATELAKPYVKWSIQPARAQDVPHAIARAYYLAMMPPRGPVLVSVPVDDWDQSGELLATREVANAWRPDPVIVARIASLLDGAQRPAFVVGGAADRDGALGAVVALAERHNARVWTAPMSGRCCFPETHPLFAGFLAAARERIVERLEGHDVVLVIGAPAFTYHVEGFGPHLPAGATLCQLVDDPDTASWAPVGVCAVGSIRLGLEDLLSRSNPATRAAPRLREPVPRVDEGDVLTDAFVLQTLAELRSPDTVIVEEAPGSRSAMQAHLPIANAEGFYTMDSGGLGYGMPAAVGVALGRPASKVICVMGDGSSMYSNQAIWSAVQLKLPILFVILNNGRYAALESFAPVFGFGPDDVVQGTRLPDLDFVALARGMGCDGSTARNAGELRAALSSGLARNGPSLIDVHIA